MWEGDEEESRMTNFNGQEPFVEGGYGSVAVWVLNSETGRQKGSESEGGVLSALQWINVPLTERREKFLSSEED